MRLEEHRFLSPRVQTFVKLDAESQGRVMFLLPEEDMIVILRELQTQEDIDDRRVSPATLIMRTYMRMRAGNEWRDNVRMSSFNTNRGYTRPVPNEETRKRYTRVTRVRPGPVAAMRARIQRIRQSRHLRRFALVQTGHNYHNQYVIPISAL